MQIKAYLSCQAMLSRCHRGQITLTTLHAKVGPSHLLELGKWIMVWIVIEVYWAYVKLKLRKTLGCFRASKFQAHSFWFHVSNSKREQNQPFPFAN